MRGSGAAYATLAPGRCLKTNNAAKIVRYVRFSLIIIENPPGTGKGSDRLV